MLTSTKRRILNIVCLILAVVSISYGLVLRSDQSNIDNVAITAEKREIKLDATTVDTQAALESSNPIGQPNN